MMSVPAAEKLDTSADLDKAMAGEEVPDTVTEDVALTLVPSGLVPATVPVLWMDPASRSAWVVV